MSDHRDLWHLRHWLQYWQLRTWIHDNLCYLTINWDTGQHSQFLRCFIVFIACLSFVFIWKFANCTYYIHMYILYYNDNMTFEVCANSKHRCQMSLQSVWASPFRKIVDICPQINQRFRQVLSRGTTWFCSEHGVFVFCQSELSELLKPIFLLNMMSRSGENITLGLVGRMNI